MKPNPLISCKEVHYKLYQLSLSNSELMLAIFNYLKANYPEIPFAYFGDGDLSIRIEKDRFGKPKLNVDLKEVIKLKGKE